LACTASTVAWRRLLPQRLTDPDRVRGAIGVALDPDGQQLVIGPRVGVQCGQPVDVGTEDFGGRWGDNLKLGSGHLFSEINSNARGRSILPV
jgi:hypothetical protein